MAEVTSYPYGPNNMPKDKCPECDTELDDDDYEPATCYYTGLGSSCGDCPNDIDCFAPLLCDTCLGLAELLVSLNQNVDTVFEI